MEVAREPLYFLFKFKASITRSIGKIHREDFSYSVQIFRTDTHSTPALHILQSSNISVAK
jgi:hypothetical protein